MAGLQKSWSSTPQGTIVPYSFTIVATGRAPGAYTVYKVVFEVKVQLPHGETVYNTYESWKRFTDFQQLYKQLEEHHTLIKAPEKLPRLVKAGYFERFKDSVIEERKASAVKLLKFASTQDHLADILSQFTEGAMKVRCMPFQQTSTPPTTTIIDKPPKELPLSKLLENQALEGHKLTTPQTDPMTSSEPSSNMQVDRATSDSPPPTDNLSTDFPTREDDSSDEEEHRDTTICSTADLVSVSPESGERGGWWTEALAITDDLDSLVEKLEEPPRGQDGISTLHITSDKSSTKSSSRSPSPGHRSSSSRKKGSDYIIQAGKLITAALKAEDNEDYQEAFDLFKTGVDLLLNGVQSDSSKRRREIVSRKTAEYLQHAEALYQEHLTAKQPTESKAAAKPHLLPDFKVIAVMDKVLLVESRHSGQRFVIKVLYKSLSAMSAAGKARNTTNRAPANCPHMVKLLHHYETPNHRIFLLLEYLPRGRLVDFVSGKRAQWRKLHAAALNPPATSTLLKKASEANTASVEEGTDMDKMLSELTEIVPPTTAPVTDSLSSVPVSDSLSSMQSDLSEDDDSLTLLRQRLAAVTSEQPAVESVSVNVQPPTPTVVTGPVAINDKPSSGTVTPQYSPGSHTGSPGKMDNWVCRLEDDVREWGAQIVLALDHLHTNGIMCRDLNPSNVLLSDSGKALLTYFGRWDFVEQRSKLDLSSCLYTAPELAGLSEANEACDWWSLGALLFEILTGQTLFSCHPSGVHSHLPLRFPVVLSPEAQSLLSQLLQVDPRERLGSGVTGAEELKSHPFFSGINWKTV